MASPTKQVLGRYSVYFSGDPLDPSLLITRIDDSPALTGKGRAGITLVRVGSSTLACRKYVHGGLFRAVTRDIFLSPGRALSELEVTGYLRDRGFPVIEPFAVIVENRALTKRLYFLTLYREGAVDLLEFLARSGTMKRMRAVKRLATLLKGLEDLGVRHPDLHLNNVLVTGDEELVFLDFDKSRRGALSRRDVIRMIWRLNRYAEKMERRGRAVFSARERALFLRTYERLAGYDISTEMIRKVRTKGLLSRIGWFVEKTLYGA